MTARPGPSGSPGSRCPSRRPLAVAMVALLAAALLGGCSDPGGGAADPGAGGGAADPGAGGAPAASLPADGSGAAAASLPGDVFGPALDARPDPVPGPDLGEAEVAPVDPAVMVDSPFFGPIPGDRLWFVLPEGSTAADAQRIAEEMRGTIGGRIEAADAWLVLIPPQSADGMLFAMEYAVELAGIDAVFPDVGAVPAADCGPELTTGIYGDGRAAPYDMIGLPDAWQILYASGVKRSPVHVGVVDTALTADPEGRVPWEFDNATWVGEPAATTDLRRDAGGNLRRGGLHHADGVMGILAGDLTDGGVVGVASPLGTDLILSHGDFQAPLDAGPNSDPDVEYDYGGRAGFVSKVMVEVKRQIERGATIINLSVGMPTLDASYGGQAEMWRRFYAKMQRDHPEILFVAAAGNNTGALDGHNTGPGGIAAPNVITVGSLQTDGSLTSYSNVADPSAPDAEVTIHAPGDQAVWGAGADGAVQNSDGGTSSATPMVAATAALIRSVDPTLKAADIKALLERSAGSAAGGDVLRVDAALREAVDAVRARGELPPLTDEEIRDAACSIEVTEEPAGIEAASPALRWNLTARLPRLAVPTTVTLTAGGARPANWRQPVRTAADAAAWSVLAPVDGVTEVVITRLDNGYWRVFRLWGSPLETPPPTPSPTLEPTPVPTPRPTAPPAAPGFDCSKPPSGEIARLNWSLNCQGIAP